MNVSKKKMNGAAIMKSRNLEKDSHYNIGIAEVSAMEVQKSDGWYLLPTEHGEDGKPLEAVWHLGRRWEAPNHPKVPRILRGTQTVIEYCQGNVTMTGQGVGVIDWHGPFLEPNDDWPEAQTCGICFKIFELLQAG